MEGLVERQEVHMVQLVELQEVHMGELAEWRGALED